MDNWAWTAAAVLIGLDLLVAVTRASLNNTRLPHLLNLREQHGEAVDWAAEVVSRPHLRISLRLAMTLLHILLTGVVSLGLLAPAAAVFSTAGGLALLAGVALVIVVSEFIVEGRVIDHPETAALRLAWLGLWIDVLFTPFSLLLMAVLGQPHQSAGNPASALTEEELRNWVEVGQPEGQLEQGERKMIFSIFQFGDTRAREVMVPRIDIIALDINTPLPEAIEILTHYGHSRVPVYEDTIDDIVGLLYAKDLLLAVRSEKDSLLSLRERLRPAYFIPEAKKVDELLTEMRSRGVHMAIVVDEYGGVAGLVTLEDIVEEIIGEIRDEYDQAEEQPCQQVGDGEYLFLGRASLDDFNEVMGTHFSHDQADTLGGYIYSQVGRVPVGGETLEDEGVLLKVEQVSARRIAKVRALRRSETRREKEKETEEPHAE
ncbi:MAG TPA: hemolysin family protein [Anaerolineaceae bacterium]|nr:hemolysin family protein [Anaerolineaceae bacterium]HPN51271.1 hemolysin family protein [Anaerolineaceae bacterium]